jgi:hypothetical protein
MTTKKINTGMKDPAKLEQIATISKKVDMENILKFYKTDLNKRQAVNQFLTSNPDVIPVLIEARSQLEKIFGQIPYNLSLEQDPDEGFEVLFIISKVHQAPAKALSLRDQFGKWLIATHSNLIGRLNLDTELV